MKLAYVVPRYGVEVIGGAEYGARMLAERLVSLRGWDVEVFTSCSLDATTWADVLPEGTSDLHGVRVNRFRSEAGRAPDFDKLSKRVLRNPRWASPREQSAWIDAQGPKSPALVDAAAASDAQLVAFYPYLFYPTVRGVPAVGKRAVMHPAAHDELPLRLPIMRPVFHRVQGLVFQTESERRLVEWLFRTAAVPQVVVGLGLEEHPGDPSVVLDEPYLVCVGRVDDAKGTGFLARFFAAYKERRPGPLKLVLVGPVIDRPVDHPDVVVTGPVDETTKWGLLRGATAYVSPSGFEAFSIALMEGWTAGLPVIVNERCGATREHVARSGGGLWFDSYASFELVLDRLLGDEPMRRQLAGAGQSYVEANFTWPAVIDRYAGFLEGLLNRRG